MRKGGLRSHLYSYVALLPVRDSPDRRSSQCLLVSSPRHFWPFLNYSRLKQLKSTTALVYLLHPRHSSIIERTRSVRNRTAGLPFSARVDQMVIASVLGSGWGVLCDGRSTAMADSGSDGERIRFCTPGRG